MTHFNFIWWGYGSKWGFPGGSVVRITYNSRDIGDKDLICGSEDL